MRSASVADRKEILSALERHRQCYATIFLIAQSHHQMDDLRQVKALIEQWCEIVNLRFLIGIRAYQRKVWGEHWDKWAKRVNRAPHWHIALWSPWPVSARWVSESWFEVVGSRDPVHREAGTKVEWPRSQNAWVTYMAKELGKEHQATCERLYGGLGASLGRAWGVVGRARLRRIQHELKTLILDPWEWDRAVAAIDAVVASRGVEFVKWGRHAYWTVVDPPEVLGALDGVYQ